MTSGFNGASLALFTTLSPAGAVAFIVIALARLCEKDHERAVTLDRAVALSFSLCLMGFIASATHLGTPANALHVFAGVGRSPLSNEVLAAVAFLFLAGSYWMAAFKRCFPNVVAKPWLAAACVAAGVFLVFTSLAYAVDTVPTWNTIFTPANLLLSALFAGPLVGLFCLSWAGGLRRISIAAAMAVSSSALVGGTVVLVLHWQSLAFVANNELAASSLVPDYPLAIAAHAVLGVAGIACASLSLRSPLRQGVASALRACASVCALCAVFVVRLVFYQLHLTVGF